MLKPLLYLFDAKTTTVEQFSPAVPKLGPRRAGAPRKHAKVVTFVGFYNCMSIGMSFLFHQGLVELALMLLRFRK